MSSSQANVAIFWDYGTSTIEDPVNCCTRLMVVNSTENCELPFNADGYSVAGGIRDIAHKYGTVKVFKAYLETKEQTSPRALSIRSELISSGVSIIDCPHNGRNDVADKMLIGSHFLPCIPFPLIAFTDIPLLSGYVGICHGQPSSCNHRPHLR